MNYLLITACGVFFLYQLTLGDELARFIDTFGFTPAALTDALEGRGAVEQVAFTGLTSLFLHVGWFHLLGNLLYLRVFGDNVEDRFGHPLFMLFYLASGFAGIGAQYLADPHSGVPMIGASGAIAGVLGAYIVLFPRAKVLTVFPIIVILTFIEVPAFVFLGIWALQQFLNGYLTLGGLPTEEGIAWFAHLGGFSLGVFCGLLTRVIKKRR